MPDDSSGDGFSLSEEEHNAAVTREAEMTTGYGMDSGSGFGSGSTNGWYIGNGYGDGDSDYGDTRGGNDED
jgi:hypothetical protein